MKKINLLIIITFLTINIYSQTVRIAAAANLRYVIEDIKDSFIQENPNTDIEITLGASGALLTQILNGAQFDFYMAADKKFPEKLKEAGAASSEVKTYAFGKLILWSNTINIAKGMNILLDKSVVHIAIAKPEIAPYGERAIEALKYYGIYDKIKNKLVYADNISQAAQFAVSGNAEVGIIAMALAFSPEMKNMGKYFILDSKSYRPVEQACVLVKSRELNPEAEKFMNFVLSKSCVPIFENYGYIHP